MSTRVTIKLAVWGMCIGLAWAALVPERALAHKDPSGESQTGVGITMEALRADGITPISGETVTECESVFFRATLNDQSGAVAFEGGEWFIELPGAASCATDGDCGAGEKCRDIPASTPKQCAVEVTPPGGIPCIGGTLNDPNSAANDGRGDDCLGSPSSITSVLVPYTVKAADVDGMTNQVTARSAYRVGYSHIDADDLFGVSASTPFPVDVVRCDDGNPCTEDVCDAQAVFDQVSGAFRQGQCTNDPIPGCVRCETAGDCDDANVCTTDTCVDDVCVQTPIEGCVNCETPADCDDGNACTTETCVADACVWTPIEGCVNCETPQDCVDNDLCTVDQCIGDVCVWTPIEFCDEDSEPCEDGTVCDDGDPCTDDECHPEFDVCIAVPVEDCTPCETAFDCNDGDACTQELCVDFRCQWSPVPECMACETPQDCDDGNGCTTNLCVEHACEYEPIPDCRPCVTDEDCGDDDLCTVDVCVDDVCVERPPFLAKVRGQLGNYGEINGSFAVNDVGGQVRLGRGVFVADGASTSGDVVRIGNGSSVYDLFGNEIRIGSDVVVRGIQGIASLPLVEPFCQLDGFQCGTSRVNVGSGASAGPLPPGTYGAVRILNGGTLRLGPGEYTFCEIRTGRQTNIVTTGPTTINVTGRVRIANGSVLGPDATSPTPVLNVLGSQVRVGAGSIMRAHLSAPNAMLTMGRQAEFRGTFCVLRTRTDKRVVLICPSDERPPSSPSGAFLN